MSRSCPARPLATTARFGSATRPVSTSSRKVSTGFKTFAGRSERRNFMATKLATALIDKRAVIERIKAERAVAIIRTDSFERALSAAKAVIEGGFRIIEITFSFPKAPAAIAKLSDTNQNNLLIGAGTILTREQADEAVAAGAR